MESVATMIRQMIKGKAGSTRHLPYKREQLTEHLEKQFVRGMTWDNYGEKWHVDHITPRSSFNISGPECPEFQACWSLSNLRPMWAKDNLSKNNKITHLI
jgi:hypothetical protein